MKKLLLIICLAVATLTGRASKVLTGPQAVRQPDGTTLTVFAHGDEHFSWYTARDGALLAHVGTTFYVAHVGEDGLLAPTTHIAHNPWRRTEGERKAVKAQEPWRGAFLAQAREQVEDGIARRIAIGTGGHYFPHTGSPKALVILVNFADSAFSVADPVKTFNQYLNSDSAQQNFGNREDRNHGSVRKYFSDMSFGQFTPQFDLKGPVTLSRGLAYYGSDEGGRDRHYTEMITEACTLIDDSVNFADYDQDGDGLVDLVYIIYPGYSQSLAQNSTDCLWPKSGAQNLGTFDGVQVYRYGINNELNAYPGAFSRPPYKQVNGIGLFVHEFSHTLGLPDLYPTRTAAQVDNQAMEYWDVMDGGEYLNNGWRPTPYTPWERETMGWMAIDTLTEPQLVRLAPIEYGGKAYKILSDNENEYLIVENIQQAGWNRSQKGHGLLVYRVDYPYTSVNLGDYPNNTVGKPGLTIVPADGVLLTSYRIDGTNITQDDYYKSLAGDPFPGTSNMTTLESVVLNRSTLTSKPLYDIQETEDGWVSFKFIDPSIVDAIHDIAAPKAAPQGVYSIDGRRVGDSLQGLPKGLYITGGKKVAI